MFELSESKIYAYKRKTGEKALHYSSHLFVHSPSKFSLTAFLESYSCFLHLTSEEKVKAENVSLSVYSHFTEEELMVHTYSAMFLLPSSMEIYDRLARIEAMFSLKLIFDLNEPTEIISKRVIILKRY